MKILFAFTEINQKFGALRFQHGLASLSAVLKHNGFRDVHLSHFSHAGELERWDDDLKKYEPDLVGFYSTAEQFHFIRQLVERVPRGIFTICGGPHPTCYPECIEDIPRLDAICLGEGEYPLLELVTALQVHRVPSWIEGLLIRFRCGRIERKSPRPFIAVFDELPLEDRELFHLQRSIDEYGLSQVRVMTSRGCPYQCTYCANHKIRKTQPGRYLRFRSVEHVMRELNELKNAYRFDEIFFDDDIFMMNRSLREDFCERYAREIGKPFVFCGRVELCSEEMLMRLKRCGGRRIDFGVESGNEELRRKILKRKMTNEQIVSATRTAQKVGLQVKTLNMVGLPDETPAQHLDTVRINQRIKPDVVSIFVFFPYPGTELYGYCVEKKYYSPVKFLFEDYVSRRESLLTMPAFGKKEIEEAFRLFGVRVFWKYSPIKAMGSYVIHSPHGERLLTLTKPIRKTLRRMLGGY